MFSAIATRSKLRRLLGFAGGIAGTIVLGAVAVYFLLHPWSLTDERAIFNGSFVASVGLTLVALALFFAGTSVLIRRVGCIGIICFGVPMLLMLTFLLSIALSPEPRHF